MIWFINIQHHARAHSANEKQNLTGETLKKKTAHCVAACTLQIPTGIKRLRWDLHIGSLEVPKLTQPKLSLKQSWTKPNRKRPFRDTPIRTVARASGIGTNTLNPNSIDTNTIKSSPN